MRALPFPRRAPARGFVYSLLALSLALAGCGGSSHGGSNPVGGGGTVPAAVPDTVTARFHVDVTTGKVTVVGSKGSSTGRSIFLGSAVGFSSSVLLDQPGTVGLKTLSVALTNNWALPIGQTPNGTVTGLKVLFGGFTNVSAASDLRPRTTVSTLAGNGSAGNANGSLGSASFNAPTGIVAAGNGTFYVTDKTGNAIRKISGGNVSTVAGSPTAGSVNGQGTSARFNLPFGIALNPVDGSLVVTDLLGNLVRRVTPDGRVTTLAGTGAASSNDGNGASATVYGPTGVAVDPSGNIFVAEYYGQRIRRIALTGPNPASAGSYTVTTLAGNGTAGGADGNGAGARFASPNGLALAPDGSLYVADQGNNAIRRVTAAGEVSTIAGTGAASSTDGKGDVATINSPRGVAFANGALFVTDRLGNEIRQLTLGDGASPAVAANWNVATLAGSGGAGTGDGAGNVATITQPQLIAADASGNLYVPDVNNLIRQIVPSEGSFPVGTPSGSAPSEPVQLSNPDGIAPTPTSSSGVPYIAYAGSLGSGSSSPAKNWNFVVPAGVTAFEFTATVEADTTALTPPEGGVGVASTNVSLRTLTGGGSHSGFVNGQLASARFNGPEYLAMDTAGNLYVADQYNAAVRRISVDGIVSTVAGDGNPGYVDGNGASARFSYPSGITVAPDGNTIYVADTVNNRIRRITLDGFDPTSPGNWNVTTIAGTGTAGGTYTSAPGNTATLNSPTGLAMDGGGVLYVSESAGNRVRRLQLAGADPTAASSWQVTILAGDVSAAAGVSGDADSSNGTSARFASPQQIACDRAGNVYVADSANKRIRVITVDGAASTLAGGVSGDTPASGYQDGAGATARFSSPTGITVDSAGLVYVADSGNNRVRCVTPSGRVTTVAGSGASGSANGLGTAATFNGLASLLVTNTGTIYVGEVNGNGVRMIERIISSGTR